MTGYPYKVVTAADVKLKASAGRVPPLTAEEREEMAGFENAMGRAMWEGDKALVQKIRAQWNTWMRKAGFM